MIIDEMKTFSPPDYLENLPSPIEPFTVNNNYFKLNDVKMHPHTQEYIKINNLNKYNVNKTLKTAK
jgi:hypothetical protein